jgi:spermidine synthase
LHAAGRQSDLYSATICLRRSHGEWCHQSMSTLPVLFVLLYDGIVLFGALSDRRDSHRDLIPPTLLFFLSGVPALIYQIVWQRALFAIYGVNSESVAIVVTAFMIGLGLGSLLGGWLSTKLPHRAVLLFGLAELCVAIFGVASLRIFQWAAALSAGAPLPTVVFSSLILLLFPTVCMGATLPLLAERLVRSSRSVGYSVGILYFANTFGSAFACYLCATFLLRDLGQFGSVKVAACINVLVAVTAMFLARSGPSTVSRTPSTSSSESPEVASLSLGAGMFLAGTVGFIALGFEIVWFRVFVLASSDRAPAFALLLSTVLSGIGGGSFISGKLTEKLAARQVVFCASMVILTAAGICAYLAPLVGYLTGMGFNFLVTAPAFFLVSALLGSIFPLVCRLAIPAGPGVGRRVSLIYLSNILGSAAGSLVIGFVLLNHLNLKPVNLLLGFGACVIGIGMLLLSPVQLRSFRIAAWLASAASIVALSIAPSLYASLFEKLVWRSQARTSEPFAHIVENRNGVITIAQSGAVFGNGVYDGFFSVNPFDDKNLIVRAFALSAFAPSPKRILMIGLSSGSWAQVLVNNPHTESLEIVEINPGYLSLIERYPAVRSLPKNPKVRIEIDDGRRWLLSHPNARYDVIVQNTSFYWRDHSSDLLSADYLRIICTHLNPGGIYYYNTTGSDDVVATGLHVFPYGLRVLNFLAVSDSPLSVDKQRWSAILAAYTIDGRRIFDLGNPATSPLLEKYMALADSVSKPPTDYAIENSVSMRAQIKNPLIITDDNMGWEWRDTSSVP